MTSEVAPVYLYSTMYGMPTGSPMFSWKKPKQWALTLLQPNQNLERILGYHSSDTVLLMPYVQVIQYFQYMLYRLTLNNPVDKDEITIRFWQEIYDERNILREIHEKYLVDKGHKKIENDN